MPSDQPFVLNVADMPAFAHPRRATILDPEPDDAPWPDTDEPTDDPAVAYAEWRKEPRTPTKVPWPPS